MHAAETNEGWTVLSESGEEPAGPFSTESDAIRWIRRQTPGVNF